MTYCLLMAVVMAAAAGPATADESPSMAQGVVFHDRDRNGRRDQGEEGLPGVRVSNGQQVVATDEEGRWQLPINDDCVLFVIKPRNWMTPVNEHQLPQFYYIHKPKGSPPQKFAGVEPTGPLPESVDFPLHPQEEPDTFKALFFGDTQPRNQEEVDYIAHDVIEPILKELKKINPSFGVTLGDVVFDDLNMFGPLNRTIALLGIPWYNVIGNHDINQDSHDDEHSTETWQRHYGPAYYSFDFGPVHFLALDDIRWQIKEGENRGNYVGGLGPEQMEFIRNDLAAIPEQQLVVLMMHIPLVAVEDRKELYELIQKRPFAMSISAHTHFQQHVFIGEEDGFHGPEKHHHVINVTVCGSWWSGTPDENGIPHTTMRDGAPNGYSIMTFDGAKYSIEFRAARRPASHQMNIFAPEEIESAASGETEVLVNVFAGSEKSVVEMRVDDEGEWVALERVERADPYYEQMKKLEVEYKLPGRKLPDIIKSPHLWRGVLPADLASGSRVIHVRTTDQFDQKYKDHRVIRVK